MKRKKKLMVILGTGGHTAQMIRLVNLMGNQYEYTYVIARDDFLSEKKIKTPGKVCRITAGVNFSFKDSKLTTFIKHIYCAAQSIFLIKKEMPDAILSCGPGAAYVISRIGKWFGCKIIFLESWSRAHNRSKAGRRIYWFSDLFFVQWRNLLKKYPRAVYAGRLA